MSMASVTVPAGVTKIILTGTIQNGNPDGVALVNVSTRAIIDTVAYGGVVTLAKPSEANWAAFPLDGVAGVTMFDDSGTTIAPVVGSIIRNPDGTDTDTCSADWKFTHTMTPGAANVLN
jgi:hypothetical protein